MWAVAIIAGLVFSMGLPRVVEAGPSRSPVVLAALSPSFSYDGPAASTTPSSDLRIARRSARRGTLEEPRQEVPSLAGRRAAKAAERLDLDALSAAGRDPARGGRSAAGRSYQKHMDRGELPNVPGKSLDESGQDLLDDILTHPGSTTHRVTTGNAAGGTRIIRPDGIGATFNPDGSLAYFGVY
jgi:hypothetical protein